MHPLLLTLGSDTGTQVIVLGGAVGENEAVRYGGGLLDALVDAFRSLASRCDAVICEGADSPAEINWRDSDIVNTGFARAARVPTVRVGDIA
jgi:adenosylcobyric acid synthase